MKANSLIKMLNNARLSVGLAGASSRCVKVSWGRRKLRGYILLQSVLCSMSYPCAVTNWPQSIELDRTKSLVKLGKHTPHPSVSKGAGDAALSVTECLPSIPAPQISEEPKAPLFSFP